MAKKNYNNLSNEGFKRESRRRKIQAWQKQDRQERHEKNINILNIVLICLLAFAVIGVLSNKQILSFGGFLELLANAPSISLEWLNWGILDVDLGILNFFLNFFNVLAFVGTASINALIFLFYFIVALFL